MNGSREFPAATEQGPVRSATRRDSCTWRDGKNRTGPRAGPARPGPGPRRLRGLAAAILLAFAALVVLPDRAAAQATDLPWTAEMTVGSNSNIRGFDESFGFGSLDDTTFTHGGTEYTIKDLYVQDHTSNSVVFLADPDLGANSDLVIEWGGESLPLASNFSTYTSGTGRGFIFNNTWLTANAPSLDNSNYQTTVANGSTMTVCIRESTGSCPDTTAPEVSTATVDGTSLVITFDEDLAAAANLANSAFTVKKTPQDGSEETVTLASSPAISGATVTLTLAAAVLSTDGDVKVSYTKPMSGSNNLLKDAADNEVASFTDRAVTNNTGRTTVSGEQTLVDNTTTSNDSRASQRSLSQRFNTGANSDGYTLTKVEIPYHDNQGDEFAVKVCTVTGDDQPTSTCTNFTVPMTFETGTLVFTRSSGMQLMPNQKYAVVLTPDAGAEIGYGTTTSDSETGDSLSDWNIAGEFRQLVGGTWVKDIDSVALRIHLKGTVNDDTSAPEVSSATVDGASLVITFNENLAAAANLANSAFTVKKTPMGGSEAPVTLTGSPAISDATVTLTLAAAVLSTDGDVKVSYTKPMSGSNNLLKDADDNEVASFTDRAVTNNTGRIIVPSERTLVDNISLDVSRHLSGNLSQRFTTGANFHGYTLTRVEIGYYDNDEFAVKVCTVTGDDQPTSVCTNFTAPTTFYPGILVFRHSSGMRLLPNRKYAVVLTPASDNTIKHGTTTSDNQGGLSDWDIASELRQLVGGTWVENAASHALRIRLKGAVNNDDTIAPTVRSATVDGASLVITFNEELAAAANLANASFTVKKTPEGGIEETVSLTGSPSISGARVTLTLAAAVLSSDRDVKVSYTKPTSGSNNLLKDFFDNEVASFTDQAVINNLEAPTVSSATVVGASLVITFSKELAAAPNLANAAFEVKKTPDGGVEETVSLTGSPSIGGATVTLTLASAVLATDGDVKVSYTVPALRRNNLLKDAATGNEVASFTDRAVTNYADRNAPATGRPTIAGVAEVGQVLTAAQGLIADANGLPATFPDDYRLQWVRVDGGTDTDIPGAISRKYRMTASDEGKRIVVKVSFTDGHGFEETLRSAATAAVAPTSAGAGVLLDTTLTVAGESRTTGCGPSIAPDSGCDRLLGEYRLTSTDQSENAIALSISSLRAWSGRPPALHLFFQQDIRSYEKKHLVLVLDGRRFPFSKAYFSNSHRRGVFWNDVALPWRAGETVRVQVRDGYENRPARGAPAISGAARVGGTLTARRGKMADGDGLPDTFSWQWVRVDGGTETDIAGATHGTYTPTDEDLGKQLKVRASFTDRRHNAEGPLVSAAFPARGGVQPAGALLDTTLTVGYMGNGAWGCGDSFNQACRNRLARTGFALAGTGYTVHDLFATSNDRLWLGVRPTTFYGLGGLVLEVGGRSFALSRSDRFGDFAVWERSGLRARLRPEDPVRVRLCDGPCQRLLSVDNARATEGPGAKLKFVVRLHPASGSTVTVKYATSDGTAKEDEDYEGKSGTLTFAPGVTERTVSVRVIDDSEEDSGETMWLSLSDPSGAAIGDNAGVGTIYNTEAEAASGLTASFSGLPDAHDGETAFTFTLTFTEDAPGLSSRKLKKSAFEVSGGRVTNAKRQTPGNNRNWTVTIEPDGDGAVGVTLPATTDCAAAGAICTADERMLADAVSETVPGPAPATPAVKPLTAKFAGLPAEHDGARAFTFQVKFSKALPEGSKNRLKRALSVTGGTTKTIVRLSGRLNHWQVKVKPDGHEAVTIVLPETTDCAAAGAICIGDGRKLSRAVTATVPGPPGLSVADAEVDEGAASAALAFVVTLSREASGTVTVEYETEDDTAAAPADYEETDGTLTFERGQVEKTVSVRVHADSENEGNETLKLKLSNPSGAYLKRAEATGTIKNTGPIPQAWLARFGRTVADQVLDAVQGRLGAARAPGVEATMAGQRLSFDTASEDTEALEAREEEARTQALTAWLRGEDGEEARGPALSGPRTVTARELFTGTSFSLTGGTPGEETVSAWGRGVVSRFDGREDNLTLDGEAGNLMLGADWTRGRATAGLMVSHAQGTGGYRGASAGRIEASLTGLYPYGRYAASERVSVWGVAGYGEGRLTVDPEDQAALETDMDLAMASVGVRGVVLEAPPEGGAELAVKSDAMAVRTTSEPVSGSTGNLAASQAGVTRLRLGLEGSRAFRFEGGASLVPSVELGVRHDGGDAETGFGADIGAGLAWSDPARGLSADARARGLLTHEDGSFRDRGFAGALAWDPVSGSARGPSLSLTRTVGGQASGGLEALLGPQTAQALEAANDDDGAAPERRTLAAKAGYGFALFDGRFTGTPALGLGLTETGREVALGWRLAQEKSAGLAFGLDVEGARQESANAGGAAGRRLGLGFGWRLEGARHERFEVRLEGSRLEPANDATEHRIGLTLTARW